MTVNDTHDGVRGISPTMKYESQLRGEATRAVCAVARGAGLARFHLRKIAGMQIELHGMASFTQFYLHLGAAQRLRPTKFVELIARMS